MNAPIKPALLNLRAAVETSPPPLDFVLPGLLAGTVGALVSQGGAGKTMAALELAIRTTTGLDLLEIESLCDSQLPTGNVAYLTSEDPAEVLAHRMHAMGKTIPQNVRETLYERLSIAPLNGMRTDVMSSVWQAWITDIAKNSRLVIIDTLRRFHVSDENDGGAMAELMGWFEALCHETRTTVLFLHHSSKAGALAGGDTQQAARGSSVLTDNARWQCNLVGMSEKEATKFEGISDHRHYVRLIFAKYNYVAPIPDVWLRRSTGGVLVPARLEPAQTKDDKKAARAYARASNGGYADGDY